MKYESKIMELKEGSWKCKIFFCVFVLFANICDTLVDWCFYVELKEIKKGLVFGPVDPSLLYAVLAFAAIATLFNVIEIVINGLQLCYSKFCQNSNDYLSLAVIFLGEMPLVLLNIITAGCREESLDVFQLSKATVITCGCLFRMIFFFVTNCKNFMKKLFDRKIFALCLFGLFLNCLGSISIFILTQTRPSSTFTPQIKAPKIWFSEIEENNKYFAGVSIYFQHDVFKALPPNRDNFIRLIRIDDIRRKENKKIFINFRFKDSDQHLGMELNRKVEFGTWETPERFTFSKSSNTIHITNGKFPFHTYNESLTFVFDFILPEGLWLKKYIFGEIEYNVHTSDSYFPSHASVPLFYFRTELSEESHLVKEMTESPRFYTHKDLTNISEVWKTGWMGCDSTGSLEPTLNTALDSSRDDLSNLM